jgi:hypothetical protein
MLNKDMKKNEKYKSSFEKLLPEPKPNSEPLLIGLPSATLAQNAMLVAGFEFFSLTIISTKVLNLFLLVFYLRRFLIVHRCNLL